MVRVVPSAFLVLLLACGPSDGPAQGVPSELVQHFTDEVVVRTYENLAATATGLSEAVAALDAAPTFETLSAARAAWAAARVPWEQSEGFLFGPVDSFGYDPALDSWPVNRTDLDAVLASGDPLTQEYVRALPDTQKGFHTVEYLLFGEGGAKLAADLSARELEYLRAVTAEFAAVATALRDSWTTSVDGRRPYREVFSTAGQIGNSAYPSVESAAQEIVNGMIGILDEVANGKIAGPFDAQDPTLVESQFSYNSLTDFQNNIRSVQNAYLGNLAGAAPPAASLASFVSSRDAVLDTEIRTRLDGALTALAAIPPPFRDAITDPEASDEIEAAQAAILAVQSTLETRLLPLVQ